MLGCLASWLFLSDPLRADIYTWDAGGGGDTNWSAGANWTNATLDNTVPAATDDAAFTGSTARTVGIGAGSQNVSNVDVTGSAAWNWTDINTLNVSNRFNYGSSGASVFRAVLGGSGSVHVTAGRLILTNANTYSGGTWAIGGNLYICQTQGFGTGMVTISNSVVHIPTGYGCPNLTVANAMTLDGTLSTDANGQNYRTLTFGGPIALTGNRTVYAHSDANSGRNLGFSGGVTNSTAGYRITKTGGGNLTFSGVNSFDGITAQAGTLVMHGTNTFPGGIRVDGGATLLVGHSNALGTASLITSNAAVHVAVAEDIVLANDLVVDGSLSTANASSTQNRTLTFTGTTTLTGDRTIDVVSDSNGGRHLHLAGPVTGVGCRITKLASGSGSGVLFLSGNNAFGGVTTSGGALLAANNNVFGVGDLIFAGGSAHVSVNDYTVTNRVLAPYPFLIQSSTAGTGDKTLTLAGPVELSGDTQVLIAYSGNGRNLDISGSISDGTGFYGIRKNVAGTGQLTLSGANAFNGGIISDIGVLKLSGDNTELTGGILLNSGTLQGVARTAGSPFGTNVITLSESSAILQLDAVNGVNDTSLGEVMFREGSPMLYVNGTAFATTWTASRLTREGRAMLIFKGTGANPYPLTANDRFKVTSAPAVINGMVAPYFIETTGDFLTYDGAGRGFQRVAAYTGGDINLAAAGDIYSPASAQTLTADREVHALKTG